MNSTLDYRDLISMAEANKEIKQKQIDKRLGQSNLKKLDPKQAKLKIGVQKFLAQKEEEERKKKEEALRKKKTLLDLRNQDRKATSRVRKMLNMTKSANKSCIADADQSLSESCTAQAGEIQPDEDDYGYTSQFAADMYKKMMEKYQATPKVSPFAKNKSQAVELPKPQSFDPSVRSSHDRIGRSIHTQDIKKESHKESKTEVVENKGKKKFIPPPASFTDLLRLAEQKSKEPIVIKKPANEIYDGPEFEFGRPMTAKEKAKYMSEQALRKRAEANFSGNSVPKEFLKPMETNASKARNNVDIRNKNVELPKLKKDINSTKVPDYTPLASFPKPENRSAPNHTNERNSSSSQLSMSARPQSSNKPPMTSHSTNGKPFTQVKPSQESRLNAHTRPSNYVPKQKLSPEYSQKPKKVVVPDPGYAKSLFNKPSSRPSNAHHSRSNGRDPSRDYSRDHSRDHSRNHSRNQSPNHSRNHSPNHSRNHSPNHSRNHSRDPYRDHSPNHSRNQSRDHSRNQSRDHSRNQSRDHSRNHSRDPYRDHSRDAERRQPHREEEFAPRRKLDKPYKGRPVIHSDEEDYDSEMDDFIDDSDVPAEDISSVIGQIFGYNKRKYMGADESDDECMETSVHQQWQEEQRSLRIGIQEDMEDIKREEEEKKRKAAFLKRQRK